MMTGGSPIYGNPHLQMMPIDVPVPVRSTQAGGVFAVHDPRREKRRAGIRSAALERLRNGSKAQRSWKMPR